MEKKSDEEWDITDAIPITETDTVGDILQHQEAKDREQFVFLTQEDASMEKVMDQLDDLTQHIKKVSMGEGQVDFSRDLLTFLYFSMERFYVLQGSLGNHCGRSGSLG